jgi:hypothetical protein
LSAPVVDRQAIIERVSKRAEAVQARIPEAAPIKTAEVEVEVARSQPLPPFPAPAGKRLAVSGTPEPTTHVETPIQSVPLSEYELQSLLLQLKECRWPPIIRDRGTVKIAPTAKQPLSVLRGAEALPQVQYALQAEWDLWMQQLAKRLSRPGALQRDPRGFVVVPEVFGADALTFLSLNRDDPDVASAVRNVRAADWHRAELARAGEKREKIRRAELAQTVAGLVARICGPSRPGTASPENRARITPDIQALAPALAAGDVTLRRVDSGLRIGGVTGAVPPSLSRLAKDTLGWQALQMIAEHTAGMSRPDETKPLLLSPPNEQSAAARTIEAVPIAKDNWERS